MSKKEPKELTEDIEVIGPGQMLADARKALNLSVSDVAQSLNFRACQVTDIEEDKFDKSLPETFNRGYLINYARLVNMPVEQILSAYEMLGIAQKQCAEMQSFSKITEKQAQNSRLNWLTYLIVLSLIALPIVYYVQDGQKFSHVESATPQVEQTQQQDINSTINDADNNQDEKAEQILSPSVDISATEEKADSAQPINIAVAPVQANEFSDNDEAFAEQMLSLAADENRLTEAIFTFAGDCWVNIQDATNERIAYGIKKAGYEMTISGVPPFKVTVGKPELVSILYNGEAIDMSQYNTGNIAKFTLPINTES